MATHKQKPSGSAAVLIATFPSSGGVIDISKSEAFTQPAHHVIVHNSLGVKAYDPAGPIFRIDQPTNISLPFPPSWFLTNLPPLTSTRAPAPDDFRIVVPVNFKDTSAGAAYHTDAIFSAAISFLAVDPGDPNLTPAYLIVLS